MNVNRLGDERADTIFSVSIESGPPGIQARGKWESWTENYRWAVARENEFGEEFDSDEDN